MPEVGTTVSNKSSYMRWNWGDTITVCKLSIRDTDPTYLGEGPRLVPSRALGSHLGNPPLPPASLFWRANTGQLNEWFSLRLGATEVLENPSNVDEVYSLSGKQFLR